MRIDVEQIRNAARGRWFSIFESLGVAVPSENKHGPCCVCGGKDRMRVDNKGGDGTYICGQHGAGDGIDLVRQALGLSFPETLKKISEVVGSVGQDDTRQESEYDRREALNRLWKSSKKLQGSDHVSKYLRSRGLVLTPNHVRFCPECYESETKTKMPAMVAQFMGPDGKPLTIHRTYLNGVGKADIKSTKKLMPGTASLVGGAIRLFEPVDSTIGIAEGIETAIAATQVVSVPCWSVVSATLMKGFVPPEGIRRVVIFADNDHSFTGQESAYCLARRLYALGLVAEVLMPEIGKDFNDYLLKMREKDTTNG
jgi:putative DNA primase/helicase